MTTENLLKLARDVQAAALVGDNIKFARKKKKKTSDFVKSGVSNILGTSLIKAQANL